MKRVSLLLVIIAMCSIVLLGGTVTFVNNNNSFIKESSIFKVEKSDSKLEIFIDIVDKKLYVISEGKAIKTYPISSGKYISPSPIGEWKIVSKDTWGEGFGGRWMGFNVPWGKYGIHGTNEPWTIGSAGSHGCIRLFNNNVAELYKIIKHGTRVVIYGGPYGPFGEGFRVIKPGTRGSDVFEIQRILKEKGFYKGYVNGIYNEAMKNAIHSFQKKSHLKISNTIGEVFYTKLGIKLSD